MNEIAINGSQVWQRVRNEPGALASAKARWGVDFPPQADGVQEDNLYYYLPVTVPVRVGDEVRRETVIFALGDERLVTLQTSADFAPFDKALARIRRQPQLAGSPKSVMRTLLQSMNEATSHVIELASASLEAMNDDIQMTTRGVDDRGREIGVSNISGTMEQLNEREESISRCQEGQLQLARAARYLRMETSDSDPDLRGQIDALLSDIEGVKQHASFEHEKVRYLQQSVMTSLNVKQNQIVKVFTIITAVFLPPTLIATFYGMNFSVMPELAWKHGFVATIAQTLLAALLPLLYIKRKGWLR